MKKRKRIKGPVLRPVLTDLFFLCAVLQLQGQKPGGPNTVFDDLRITEKQAGYMLLKSMVVTFAEF